MIDIHSSQIGLGSGVSEPMEFEVYLWLPTSFLSAGVVSHGTENQN